MNDSNWIADDEYPPRFTIEVVGTMATDCELLCVSFTGATRKLALQKPLALQTSNNINCHHKHPEKT